ncbi:MAG: transcription antitermination factor NusB [Pseudomonadota bacterium]
MSEADLPFDLRRARRAGARLAAVQALYQMEQTGRSAKAVIREFMEDRLGYGPEGEPVEEADPDLFKSVVNAVIDQQVAIDAAITLRLSQGWKLSRLDTISRAILRAGSAEFLVHPELSNAIIIDEYVSLAHDFFEDGAEAKFVNGVLEKLGTDLRAA